VQAVDGDSRCVKLFELGWRIDGVTDPVLVVAAIRMITDVANLQVAQAFINKPARIIEAVATACCRAARAQRTPDERRIERIGMMCWCVRHPCLGWLVNQYRSTSPFIEAAAMRFNAARL